MRPCKMRIPGLSRVITWHLRRSYNNEIQKSLIYWESLTWISRSVERLIQLRRHPRPQLAGIHISSYFPGWAVDNIHNLCYKSVWDILGYSDFYPWCVTLSSQTPHVEVYRDVEMCFDYQLSLLETKADMLNRDKLYTERLQVGCSRTATPLPCSAPPQPPI